MSAPLTPAAMKQGCHPDDRLLSFEGLRHLVGFEDYYEEDDRYAGPEGRG